MAQRTVTNIPEFAQTVNAAQQTVRPEIQPAIQNFLAQQQISDARNHQALAAKLEQAKLGIQGLQNDSEIQNMRAKLAETQRSNLATEGLKDKELGIERDKLSLLKPKETTEEKELAKRKVKIAAEAPKAKGALDTTIREFDNMINEAKAIKADPGLEAATGKSSYIPGILNEGKRNVGARIDTLKAKTLLNVLSSLKQLSAQGASGFGSLSEKEGETIKNSISSLDTKQDTPAFLASLDRFINEIDAKKQSYINTYNSVYGDAQSTDPNSDKKAALRAKLGL